MRAIHQNEMALVNAGTTTTGTCQGYHKIYKTTHHLTVERASGGTLTARRQLINRNLDRCPPRNTSFWHQRWVN